MRCRRNFKGEDKRKYGTLALSLDSVQLLIVFIPLMFLQLQGVRAQT